MPLEENVPAEQNGLSFSYKILNFRKQEVGKKGDFDRYEINVQVASNRGCDFMIWLTGNERSSSASNFPLGEFRCLNATGARLTAKTATILPEARYAIRKYNERGTDGKNIEKRENILAGYWLRNGGFVENRIIVIVPPGEKPQFEVRGFTYPTN